MEGMEKWDPRQSHYGQSICSVLGWYLGATQDKQQVLIDPKGEDARGL